jgi:1-acyl-sn-glycerol-3-phosphate acyltransferase
LLLFVKKIISYPFTIIYYALFGSTLGIFHLLQIITFNFLGYSAHKRTVDLMNFFLLKCLNFLGIQIHFDRPLNLTTGKSLIIVANHQSTYDIPPIIWYLKKFHPKFISKKQLGRGIPGVSYNLRNGGSVLIDRSRPEESIAIIKIFAQKLERNKWSAVIFPEGTRSLNGKPKKFHKKGLMTLIENMPNAVILPISINNSWRIAQYNYFPIPIGIKITFTSHKPIILSDISIEKALFQVEKVIRGGINFKSPR